MAVRERKKKQQEFKILAFGDKPATERSPFCWLLTLAVFLQHFVLSNITYWLLQVRHARKLSSTGRKSLFST
jgi:hypothetical protein